MERRATVGSGSEVSTDQDLKEKLKAWKKTQTSKEKPEKTPPAVQAPATAKPTSPKKSKPQGFAPVDVAEDIPKEAIAVEEQPVEAVAPAPAHQPVFAGIFNNPSPEKLREAAIRVADNKPASPSDTAADAMYELQQLAQQETDPGSMSPDQLFTVIFAYCGGLRFRNQIDAPVQLNEKQSQLLYLKVHTALNMVQASKDFWPYFCGELAASPDPDVKDLVAELTGIPPVRR